jgi:hypothetical protein
MAVMLKASSLFPAEFWTAFESARYKDYMGENWLPAAGIGHNYPLSDDQIAKLTPWQLFIDCVWMSEEDTNTKIMLLCIARFMDKQLRGSSMSYSQIARDCGFSEPTAKRCSKKVRARWLRVGVGKGRYVPGKGNENLYHGVIPPDLLDELRRRKSGVSERYPETADEVSVGHPEHVFEVSDGYPEEERGITQTQPGYQADTLTPHIPQRKKEYPQQADRRDVSAAPSRAEIDVGFEEWWKYYPRKEDKLDAQRAYTARVTDKDSARRATIPQLLAAVKAHKFSTDRKFIKLPATWLNKRSWKNEPSLPTPPKPLLRYGA